MTYFQAIFMALLQGVTELFPVSSLGHAVIVPAVLVWPIDLRGPGFLPFLIILHLGTAAALLLFFWRDWVGVAAAAIGAGDPETRPAMRRLLWMLVVGTIPAAIVGAGLNHFIKGLFAQPMIAALFLAVNGVVLWVGDRRHRLRSANGSAGKALEQLSVADAAIIGIAQCAALIPGISRSGATIVAGLGRGLAPDAAARFSFLLAAPIIGGAALLEVPKLLKQMHAGNVEPGFLTMSVISGVAAGIAAWLSVAFLTRYFKMTEVKMMRPFAIYCALVGVAALVWFNVR
jgi:undecaprenyl-diphosphatase